MQVETVQDQALWEDFLNQFNEANFLQSWAWKNFEEKMGKKVFALRIFDNQETLALALVVSEKAKRGNYLTIAAGPLLNWQKQERQEIILVLLDKLKEIAKNERAIFLRLRPQAVISEDLKSFFKKQGFKKSPMHLTADLTLQLDLTLSEDELLAQMRKNTRYEVRKAKKLGIETILDQDPESIKAFYEQQLAVAKRHNFVPFSYDFLHEQFLSFLENDQVTLIHSYLNGELLASAFIIFYRHEAIYHYGISTEKNARLPGSYACQWATILEAKKRGQKIYNFWGIGPIDQPKHRFAGVGLFKRGFGGDEVAYFPAQDYPFSIMYWPSRVFEIMRKKLRGL